VGLSAGYAYTQAKFREGTFAGSPFVIGTDIALEGRTVPLVPEHKLNVGAFWDVAPRTRLSAALTAVSDQFMDNDEPNTLGRKIPAYYVMDLKFARTFSWGRIAATLNNLFDEKYYDYAVRSQFAATPDRYSVYPLPGRTFGLAAEVLLH
jgi:iron complex outermembrane receptor protein